MRGRLGPGGPLPVNPGGNPQGRLLYGIVPWWLHVVELMIIVGVLVVILLLVRSWLKSPRVVSYPPGTTVNPALAELDLRYARGEIDREDYLTRRADLMGPGQVPPASPPSDAPPMGGQT